MSSKRSLSGLAGDFRNSIRRRAWELAKEAYMPYIQALEDAVNSGRLQPKDIHKWVPPQRTKRA